MNFTFNSANLVSNRLSYFNSASHQQINMDRPNRSHPTLGPLTSLPTFPHASPSYIYPSTSIPSTPSLLSRPSSQTRLRPARSAATPVPPSASSPALQAPAPKKKRTIRNPNDTEDDWVTRTASALTLTRLEEKGQSWLAARHSSTSLTGGDVGDDECDPCSPAWNAARVQSARGSNATVHGPSRALSRRGSRGGGDRVRDEEGEAIGPDFVDGEEVDEGEMKRVVMGRVGGWVDWAVGWMDFRGDGEEGGDADGADGADTGEHAGAVVEGGLDPVELQKRLRKKKRKDDDAEVGGGGTNSMCCAPEQAGFWSDARWLLGVATKAAL